MESEVRYSDSPPSYAPTATAPSPQQHPSATGQAPNDEHSHEKLQSPAPPPYDYPRSTPYPTTLNTYPAPDPGPAPYPPQYNPPTSGQAPYVQNHSIYLFLYLDKSYRSLIALSYQSFLPILLFSVHSCFHSKRLRH